MARRGHSVARPPVKTFRALWLLMMAFGAGLLLVGASAQDSDAPQTASGGVVRVIEVSGPIGPATTSFITGAIEDSASAEALVIALDTPGGLDAALREINQAILAADTPVITYVSPQGARAASAGLYMLYASHVAAMSPGTSTGAATPVDLGGGGPSAPSPPSPAPSPVPAPEPAGGEAPAGPSGGEAPASSDNASEADAQAGAEEATASSPEALRRKVVNDAVSYIRSLAELRGRNADWAEEAVRDAATVTYSEALEIGVIDIVASDVRDLLQQIDGREIALQDGRTVTLDTAGADIVRVEMTLAQSILTVITDPNIAFLLVNLGFIGLLVSFYNGLEPITAVAGLLCLIVGFYALNTLPVNIAGAALILLGLALFIAEAFVSSFGLLTLAGLVAFGIGALILVDTDVAALRLDWRVVAGVGAAAAGTTFLVVTYGLAAQGRKPTTGSSALVGRLARVESWDGAAGYVHIEGENWRAVSSDALAAGDMTVVVGVDDLTLTVRKATEKDLNSRS